MTNHSANRPNARRTLRVALLCAGVLVLGACSGNTPEATGGDATTVPSRIPAASTIDAETVKDAIRNALEGPVRVSGVDSVSSFAIQVDEAGNWWGRSPLNTERGEVLTFADLEQIRYVNGEWYRVVGAKVNSPVWVRDDDSNPAGSGVPFTTKLLQAITLLDLFEIYPESSDSLLTALEHLLANADVSLDQDDGWTLSFDDDGGNNQYIRVVLDDAGRLASLWDVGSNRLLLYDRSTGFAPIGAPETYLEGDDAALAVASEELAHSTRSAAEAMGRNTSAIAALEGNGDVLDKHFEAAWAEWDETRCSYDDCSFDLTTKTFSLTQQGYTCSTTFLIDEYQSATVTDPACSKN